MEGVLARHLRHQGLQGMVGLAEGLPQAHQFPIQMPGQVRQGVACEGVHGCPVGPASPGIDAAQEVVDLGQQGHRLTAAIPHQFVGQGGSQGVLQIVGRAGLQEEAKQMAVVISH